MRARTRSAQFVRAMRAVDEILCALARAHREGSVSSTERRVLKVFLARHALDDEDLVRRGVCAARAVGHAKPTPGATPPPPRRLAQATRMPRSSLRRGSRGTSRPFAGDRTATPAASPRRAPPRRRRGARAQVRSRTLKKTMRRRCRGAPRCRLRPPRARRRCPRTPARWSAPVRRALATSTTPSRCGRLPWARPAHAPPVTCASLPAPPGGAQVAAVSRRHLRRPRAFAAPRRAASPRR